MFMRVFLVISTVCVLHLFEVAKPSDLLSQPQADVSEDKTAEVDVTASAKKETDSNTKNNNKPDENTTTETTESNDEVKSEDSIRDVKENTPEDDVEPNDGIRSEENVLTKSDITSKVIDIPTDDVKPKNDETNTDEEDIIPLDDIYLEDGDADDDVSPVSNIASNIDISSENDDLPIDDIASEADVISINGKPIDDVTSKVTFEENIPVDDELIDNATPDADLETNDVISSTKHTTSLYDVIPDIDPKTTAIDALSTTASEDKTTADDVAHEIKDMAIDDVMNTGDVSPEVNDIPIDEIKHENNTPDDTLLDEVDDATSKDDVMTTDNITSKNDTKPTADTSSAVNDITIEKAMSENVIPVDEITKEFDDIPPTDGVTSEIDGITTDDILPEVEDVSADEITSEDDISVDDAYEISDVPIDDVKTSDDITPQNDTVAIDGISPEVTDEPIDEVASDDDTGFDDIIHEVDTIPTDDVTFDDDEITTDDDEIEISDTPIDELSLADDTEIIDDVTPEVDGILIDDVFSEVNETTFKNDTMPFDDIQHDIDDAPLDGIGNIPIDDITSEDDNASTDDVSPDDDPTTGDDIMPESDAIFTDDITSEDDNASTDEVSPDDDPTTGDDIMPESDAIFTDDITDEEDIPADDDNIFEIGSAIGDDLTFTNKSMTNDADKITFIREFDQESAQDLTSLFFEKVVDFFDRLEKDKHINEEKLASLSKLQNNINKMMLSNVNAFQQKTYKTFAREKERNIAIASTPNRLAREDFPKYTKSLDYVSVMNDYLTDKMMKLYFNVHLLNTCDDITPNVKEMTLCLESDLENYLLPVLYDEMMKQSNILDGSLISSVNTDGTDNNVEDDESFYTQAEEEASNEDKKNFAFHHEDLTGVRSKNTSLYIANTSEKEEMQSEINDPTSMTSTNEIKQDSFDNIDECQEEDDDYCDVSLAPFSDNADKGDMDELALSYEDYVKSLTTPGYLPEIENAEYSTQDEDKHADSIETTENALLDPKKLTVKNAFVVPATANNKDLIETITDWLKDHDESQAPLWFYRFKVHGKSLDNTTLETKVAKYLKNILKEIDLDEILQAFGQL